MLKEIETRQTFENIPWTIYATAKTTLKGDKAIHHDTEYTVKKYAFSSDIEITCMESLTLTQLRSLRDLLNDVINEK